jgi:hypothetical protein
MKKGLAMASEAHLRSFLLDLYGTCSSITRVEVEVEELSGGAHGTPHCEAHEVRVYAGEEQVPPDLDAPYWKRTLDEHPGLFSACHTPQEVLDTAMDFLCGERVYLDYALDWPASGGTVVSPLCFTAKQLHLPASPRRRRGEKGKAPTPAYRYTVYVSTVQTLNGEVTVASDHPLSDEAISEKAVELANDTNMHWEQGDIAPDIDIDEIETETPAGKK